MTFNESNGSQGEQVDDIVGMEESSTKAIQKLATGEVKPQEQVDQDNDELIFHGPSMAHSAVQLRNSGHMSGDSGSPILILRTGGRTFRVPEDMTSTSTQDHRQAEEEAEPIQQQAQISHPRVHQSIQKDHPMDNILGSINKGRS